MIIQDIKLLLVCFIILLVKYWCVFSFLQKKCNLLESPFNFLCNHNFKIKFELKYCKLHTAAFSRKQPNVILSAVHFRAMNQILHWQIKSDGSEKQSHTVAQHHHRHRVFFCQQIYKRVVNRRARAAMLILYLNKYLSDVAVLSCFPTVVYGTSWIRERMGSDREWQFIPSSPPNWHVTFSDDFIVLPVTALNLCVSQAAAAHATTSRQQS